MDIRGVGKKQTLDSITVPEVRFELGRGSNSQDRARGFERYWLCSKKLAVYVPSNIPLWTQIQKGHLTLQSQVSDSPYASFPVLDFC